MGKLIRFELRRLRGMKSLYICVAIVIAMVLLSAATTILLQTAFSQAPQEIMGTMGDMSDFASDPTSVLVGALNNGSFVIIAGVFISILVCEDFGYQIVKNIYARGFSRQQVYAAKLVTSLLATVIMYVLVELAAYLIGGLLFGFTIQFDSHLLGLLGAQFVVILANSVFSFLLASLIRKNSGAIAAIILVPTLMDLLLTVIAMLLKLESSALSGYWLSSMSIKLSVPSVTPEEMLGCVIASVVLIPVMAVLGSLASKRIDL